jgi:hypothetical protein
MSKAHIHPTKNSDDGSQAICDGKRKAESSHTLVFSNAIRNFACFVLISAIVAAIVLLNHYATKIHEEKSQSRLVIKLNLNFNTIIYNYCIVLF